MMSNLFIHRATWKSMKEVGKKRETPRWGNKWWFTILLIASFVVAPSSSIYAQGTIDATTSDASLRVAVPPPVVTVQVDPVSGQATFIGEQLQYLTLSGEPAIPYQVVTLLLPPDTDLRSVRVNIEGERLEAMPGRWTVAPMPPLSTWTGEEVITIWPPDKTIVDGQDVAIYGQDLLFPEQVTLAPQRGALRRWLLVDVPLALYRYNPNTAELFRWHVDALTIQYTTLSMAQITTELEGTWSDSFGDDLIKQIAVNYQQMSPQYPPPIRASSEPNDYVIITTKAIKQNSTALARFVNSKEERGFSVMVAAEPTWGGGTGDIAAENIRRWLKRNYVRREIKYVLLIGNPNPNDGDVPMKMLWPRSYDTVYRNSPSDYYYSDLTGNWDLDGDGLYGEWGDDFGPGGVDVNFDVIVGRIPYYGDMAALDAILDKLIAYENKPMVQSEWRKNALLPMVPSDSSTPGYHLGEAIKNDLLLPAGDWGYHRLYQENYGLVPPPETVPVSVNNVTNVWANSAFGTIFWWTHGWWGGASSVMDNAHVPSLNDVYPGFTFQASCNNAEPEYDNNLAYRLLQNGAIGTIAATRVSWYYIGQTVFHDSPSNAGLAYAYAHQLIRNELDSGTALHLVKRNIYPWIWMNWTVFNLYGDPSMGIATHPVDRFLFVSSSTNGNVGGFYFADEDILAYNLRTGEWYKFFDGSDVGLAAVDVNAFALTPNGELLLSVNQAGRVENFGWLDDSDIVKFVPTSLGRRTAGHFERYFDGSDVGLTTAGEDISAIGFNPDGKLTISTLGSFAVPQVTGQDKDLLLFEATTWGRNTSGTWSLYFDGSDVGLDTSTEDLWGVRMDAESGKIFLTTQAEFQVPDVAGDGADVFICQPQQVGTTTKCQFFPFWKGADYGFGAEQIDALDIGQWPASMIAMMQAAEVEEVELNELVLADTLADTIGDDVADNDTSEDIDIEELFEIFLPLVRNEE